MANRWKSEFKHDGRQRLRVRKDHKDYTWTTYGGGEWTPPGTINYTSRSSPC